MRRWLAFLNVCAFLRDGLLERRPGTTRVESWEALIDVGNLYHVAPAVAWCMRDRKDIPSDVASYFDEITNLSRRREEAMLGAFERACVALNAAGIEPVLLKGIAHLAEGLYPPGTRLLGDVDLLLDTEVAQRATQSLLDLGYSVSDGPLPEGHHHLPVLIDRDTGLGIELHTRLEPEIDNAVMPLAWFKTGLRAASFRQAKIRLPDPTRLVAHNFVHHRVNKRGHPSPLELRWLLDMALIEAKHRGTIDWTEIDRLCDAAGVGQELADCLMFAEQLLGQPNVKVATEPAPDAMLRLREYVDPSLRRFQKELDTVTFSFSGSAAWHHSGYCWHVQLPDEFANGDTEFGTRLSDLELFHGDSQLGPPFAPQEMIERIGGGAYRHGAGTLYFSTQDNSSPRDNAEAFRVKAIVPASRNLIGTIRSLSTERSDLLAERSDLLAERSGLLTERSGLLAERSGLLTERSDLSAERSELSAELDGMTRWLKLEQQHAANLTAGLEKERQHAADLKQAFDSEISRLNGEIRQMRASIFWRARTLLASNPLSNALRSLSRRRDR